MPLKRDRYHGLHDLGQRAKSHPKMATEPFDAAKVRANPPLHREYIRRYQEGDQSVAPILIAMNKPFIQKVSRQFSRGCPQNYEDFVQIGVMALLEGYSRFDFTQKVEPLTYTSYFVRGYIREELAHRGTCIRIPRRVFEHEKVSIGRRFVFTFSEMPDVFHDMPERYENTIPDEGDLSDQFLSEGEVEMALPKLVKIIESKLGARDQVVFRERYLKGHTLESIGGQLSLSRERIRQILVKIMKRMVEDNPVGGHKVFADWLLSLVEDHSEDAEFRESA